MQITFIRHLPTEWNERTLLQGKRDTHLMPVTSFNRNKILDNKKQLEKVRPFDLVLASSMKRTQQTANHYGYEGRIEPLLDELDFGEFEGKPKDEIIKKYGDIWFENPREITLGERMTDLEKRINTFLNKYQDYSNILVFGHGSWIRAFLSYVRFGHINEMNKITVENNECITLNAAQKMNKR